MAAVARKLFYRHAKELRLRTLSVSAVHRKKDDFIIHSTLPDITIPNMRLLDRLWLDYASFQNHVALECAETKKSYTYQQLRKNMAIFGTSLRKKLGLQPGDVVAIMLPNSPEFAVAALGAIQAGCIVTTVNPIYKEFEVTHQAATTDPKVFVTMPECYDIVVKGLKEAKIKPRIILVDNPSTSMPSDVIRYSEIAEKGEADYALLDKVERKPDDVAFIPFSSGTTGLPKGVEITHRNILASLEIMAQPANCFPRLTQGKDQDVLPCILPFFHIYGLVIGLLGHLAKGSKHITMQKFSASLFFDILKAGDCSLIYIVPPIAILLGKHPDVKPEFFKRLRHIVCGAAPLSASDVEAVMEKSKKHIEFNQGFGATETTSLTTSTFIGTKVEDYSACGVPMASIKLKFVDPLTNQPVPVGQQGEMYVGGPTIMKGYHKNEAATKDCITEDGFFKTGDLGHFDPKNGLYITDRIKELIKVKGMQVAPAELEALLRSHPAVQEAAVIGIPHEFYGESPKAYIIKKKDVKVTPEELQSFVAGKVAPFKKIEEVMFVDDIPKTSSGKILRRELKKMYA